MLSFDQHSAGSTRAGVPISFPAMLITEVRMGALTARVQAMVIWNLRDRFPQKPAGLADEPVVNRVVLLLLAAMAVCSSVLAEEPDGAGAYQELFLSETVYPQEARELQVTLRCTKLRGRGDRFSLPTALEYGITDRFELSVEWKDMRAGRRNFRSDATSVGLKRSFLNVGGDGLHLASGAEARSDGIEPYLAWAKDLKRGVQLFGQFSIEWDREHGEGEEASFERSANSTLGFIASRGPMSLTTELAWHRSGGYNSAEAAPGLIVRVTPKYHLGFAVPLRIAAVPGHYEVGRPGFTIYLVHEMAPWSH